MVAAIELNELDVFCSSGGASDIPADRSSEATAEQILLQELGYIYSEEFDGLTICSIEQELASVPLYEELDTQKSNTSDLPPYLASLYEIPLLTAKGEQILFKAMNFYLHVANQKRAALNPARCSKAAVRELESLVKNADRLRQWITQSNLRLIVSIARKYSHNPLQFDEMVGEGNLILLKAVDKFNYSMGYRFSTYVTHSVQRHLFRFMKRRQRVRKAEIDFPDLQLYENLGTSEQEDPLLAATASARSLLSRMHEVLDEREQFLVRERFGFENGGKTRTLKSLAGDMGICKERVRQVLNKALQKLQEFATENPHLMYP